MILEKQCIFFLIFQAVIVCIKCEKYQVITAEDPTYEPTWESLDARPLPKWYDEAKVGIFLHWGNLRNIVSNWMNPTQ